jgi:hypothetical protein
MNKITILKKQIEEQREWGHNKVADLLADDLAAQLALIPDCWKDVSEEDASTQ